jgi:hypothetical protein
MGRLPVFLTISKNWLAIIGDVDEIGSKSFATGNLVSERPKIVTVASLLEAFAKRNRCA